MDKTEKLPANKILGQTPQNTPQWPSVFTRLFRGCNKGRNNCRCFCVELVKLVPVHQYSAEIFIYSGSFGILGSDGKQNTP